MRITHVGAPNLFGKAVHDRVAADIETALNSVVTIDGQFTVNDTRWYALNDRRKVKPCVMNSAAFISDKFLDALELKHWEREKDILDQRIDAFIELSEPATTYIVPESSFLDSFRQYLTTNEGQAYLRVCPKSSCWIA